MSDTGIDPELLALMGGSILGGGAPVDRGPLYGYDEDNQIPDPATGTTFTEGRRFRPAGTTIGRQTMPGPIYADTIVETLYNLSDDQRNTLALEMFAFVPGAYRDIDEMTLEDGTLNDEAYFYAVQQTIQMAERFGPEGIANNPLYIDILMGDNERTPEEIFKAFQERAAQLSRGGGGGGGGRIINYIDPVGLAAAAKNAFASTTGRKATKAEQQEFVKNIHGLQSSGATGIDVGSRAEAFAASSAPAEAGAMDYAGAASLVMQQVMGR
jgi:hypothetical protein